MTAVWEFARSFSIDVDVKLRSLQYSPVKELDSREFDIDRGVGQLAIDDQVMKELPHFIRRDPVWSFAKVRGQLFDASKGG